MGTAEWDNLLWWERRTYLEGFEAEELVSHAGVAPSSSAQPESGDRYESPPPDLANAPVGGFAALGFTELSVDLSAGTVQRVGPPGA